MNRPGGLHYLRILAVVLLLGAALRLFVLDAVAVSSRSMEPSILPGDYLLLDRTGYAPAALAFRTPGRGEVVAFTLPEGMERSGRGAGGSVILKRCIAAAGDTIACGGGRFLVNGAAVAGTDCGGVALFRDGLPKRVPRAGDSVPLDSAHCALWRDLIVREGHTLEYVPGGGALLDSVRAGSYTIRRDYMFVTGDNSALSLDSRSWGFIPSALVVGKAVAIYWSTGGSGDVRWERIGRLVD